MSPQNEPNFDLIEIANAMTTFSTDHIGIAYADAGMTYIGQMISHDIVSPTKKNAYSRTVTPYLNLDSIYGGIPAHVLKFAPEKSVFLDKTGRFKMSKYRGLLDLKRRNTRKGWEAVIPEPRNDDNKIISQLHLFWQKVHNWLLDKRYAEDALEAQKYTVMLFQLVVIEGFCKSFFSEKVFELFFRKNEIALQLQDHYEVIPDFFSNASFRFGHSIVRRLYSLNSDPDFPEQKISSLLSKQVRLVNELEIDWNLFFASGNAENKALKIDTYAVNALRSVPSVGKKPIFDIVDLIEINLKAGQFLNPAEGDKFIDHLRSDINLCPILKTCGVTKLTSLSKATFKGINGLTHKNLPLWLYILLEAEEKQQAVKLGNLGSFLNARVLYSAIHHSEFSVIGHAGYNFDKALKMLNKGLSIKLKKTIDLIASKKASSDPEMCSVMEALILRVN